MQKAAAESKRVLIFFAASGTDRSQCFEEKVFENNVICREITWRYVPVKLDFNREGELASQLGIFRGGTVLLYTNRGEKLGVITECLQPSEFLSKLE